MSNKEGLLQRARVAHHWFIRHKLNIVRDRAHVCGHTTRSTHVVRLLGDLYLMTLPGTTQDGTPQYCRRCVIRSVRQCGGCRKPIIVGDCVGFRKPGGGVATPGFGGARDRFEWDSEHQRVLVCAQCAPPDQEHGVWLPHLPAGPVISAAKLNGEAVRYAIQLTKL